MNKELMVQILNKIKEYDKIIISRHLRPDGDCVGATMGFKDILKDSFPDKDIRLINNDYAQYLEFLGEEDKQEDESFYSDALVIVIDTSNAKRCSNPLITKAKEIIKIDHHIECIKRFCDVYRYTYKSSNCFCFNIFIRFSDND